MSLVTKSNLDRLPRFPRINAVAAKPGFSPPVWRLNAHNALNEHTSPVPPAATQTLTIPGGWPIQALFWLEWGCSAVRAFLRARFSICRGDCYL